MFAVRQAHTYLSVRRDSFNRHNTLKYILPSAPFYRWGDLLRSHTTEWGSLDSIPEQAGSKAHILNYYVRCSLITVISWILNSLNTEAVPARGASCYRLGGGGGEDGKVWSGVKKEQFQNKTKQNNFYHNFVGQMDMTQRV